MSQEKVDLKKEQKKNRKKLNRKAKVQRVVGTLCAILVFAAAIAWVGFSAYDKYQKNQEALEAAAEVEYTPIDVSALSDYVSGLSNTNTEAE